MEEQAVTERAAAEAPEGPPPAIRVLDMAAGYWNAQVVHATAKLGVADALEAGPKAATELAGEIGADPNALERLLRAAAGLGLLRSTAGGYELTEMGDCLRGDAPSSVRNTAIVVGEEHYEAWAGLTESVRTGETAFDRRFGRPVFEWLEGNPAKASEFNRFMAELARNVHVPTLAGVDFSQSRRVVDIGGGTGTLLAWVLGEHPHLEGALFDLEPVVAEARETLSGAGVADRCELVSGDYMTDPLPDGDTYMCSLVLHDHPDEKAIALLRRVAGAMDGGDRFIAIEGVVPEDDSPHLTKVNDLNMLVMTGGRERTLAEFEQLFAAAGLRLAEAVDSPTPEQALIAVPA